MARPDAGLNTFDDARAVIAVMPLAANGSDAEASVMAEIMADDVIRGLSASSSWRVISRMTTMAFRQRKMTLEAVHRQLKATYVVSGSCITVGGRVRLAVEVADATSATVVWAGTLARQAR